MAFGINRDQLPPIVEETRSRAFSSPISPYLGLSISGSDPYELRAKLDSIRYTFIASSSYRELRFLVEKVSTEASKILGNFEFNLQLKQETKVRSFPEIHDDALHDLVDEITTLSQFAFGRLIDDVASIDGATLSLVEKGPGYYSIKSASSPKDVERSDLVKSPINASIFTKSSSTEDDLLSEGLSIEDVKKYDEMITEPTSTLVSLALQALDSKMKEESDDVKREEIDKEIQTLQTIRRVKETALIEKESATNEAFESVFSTLKEHSDDFDTITFRIERR